MYCVCWRNIEVSHIHYPDECQCMSMEQSLQYIRPIWIVFWSGCTYGSLNCGTKLIVIWTVFLTIVFADPSLTLAEIIWLKFKGKNSVLQWCAKEKRSCDSSQACSTSHFQRHFRLSLLALRPTSSSWNIMYPIGFRLYLSLGFIAWRVVCFAWLFWYHCGIVDNTLTNPPISRTNSGNLKKIKWISVQIYLKISYISR